MTRLASIIARSMLLVCVGAGPGFAESRYQASRVVAFGDVHGAYGALTELLIQVGVVDAGLRWRAGDTHLVSLGDVLDRGPDSRAVLDLLQRLQVEAAAAGGRVHVLLGNHELMNLTGDMRYVSAGERRAFADPQTAASGDPGLDGLRAAYAPDGPYGRWLLQQPVSVVINDTAFVHGGLSPLLADIDPEALNTVVRARLEELLALRARLTSEGLLPADMDVHDAAARLEDLETPLVEEQASVVERFVALVRDPLFADEGPFWYRGNAMCHALIEEHNLAGVLRFWGVTRVLVGHTPTRDHRVYERIGGKVLLADTGMLTSHYGGRASAVLMEMGEVSVRYADEPGATPPLVDSGEPLAPLDETDVLAALADFQPASQDEAAWEPLAVGAGAVAARFTETTARSRNAELAAWRLDRLLDLNLAAPVTPLRHNGRDGLVVATWPGAVTEEQRAASQGSGPPPCAGASVFDLLYAFDALIGNMARTSRTILYEPRTRRLGSIGHASSFGRARRLPAYLERTPGRIPAALAQRLAALDETMLRTALGELLDRRQVRALLQRRDLLLSQWPVEG